jgi:hypothetical protein
MTDGGDRDALILKHIDAPPVGSLGYAVAASF